jgi:hypothetical protein
MSDYEVKDLFERVLDTPEPPLPEVARIVAAGRATRRRRALQVSGAALTVLLLTGAGAAHLLSRDPGTPPQHGVARATSPHPTPNVTRFLPSRSPATDGLDRTARAKVLLADLLHAVPAGYTAPRSDLVRNGGQGYQVRGYQIDPAGPDHRSIYAHTDVYRNGMAGSLRLTLVVDPDYSPPPARLCAAPIPGQHSGQTRCSVTLVHGVAVRTDDRELSDGTVIFSATVFRTGYSLTLSAGQHGVYPGRGPLPAPPLSKAQLATFLVNDVR